MSKASIRKESLEMLRFFCSQPPNSWHSYKAFMSLINNYPLQFLLYSQFTTHFKKYFQQAKDSVLLKFQDKVNRLFEYPLTETEIVQIEKMYEELDNLINLKKQINNN